MSMYINHLYGFYILINIFICFKAVLYVEFFPIFGVEPNIGLTCVHMSNTRHTHLCTRKRLDADEAGQEALQDIVYIQLPPGINFGISLKRSEITQNGYFWWSPLNSQSQDFTKKSSLQHHISFITHHILQNNNDQNGCALQQLNKTIPKEVCKLFF